MANFVKLAGSGAGSAYQAADPFGYQSAEKLRNNLNLLMNGLIGRNQYWGGDDVTGILASAATDAIGQGDGFLIDNTGNQISGSTGSVVQVRCRLRVENSAISVTPRIFNVTDNAVATTSGAAACSATNTDFSGTNQQQTLTLTLATGAKKYKLQFTPSAGTYQVWVSGILSDIYIM